MRIRDFVNFLVVREMNVRHAKVGNGNKRGVALVNIHDAIPRHESMTFGNVLMGNYLYYACRLCAV